MSKVRVRIAPTPSGKLHLGTAHTALFNYLFARHSNGKFILRIDDTDPKRITKEFENDIIDSLKWLGIEWDEGPDIGGPYAPYRQSQRTSHYQPYIQKLLKENKVYYCYCSPEELEKERVELREKKLPPKYSGRCRNLTQNQIVDYQKQGRKPAIRLVVPNKIVSFIDPARGKISVDAGEFGDFIIARADGTPVLGLAATVDDLEMKITHAIRGEDYINFVPRQILIFEALNATPPVFAHLPFVYAQDGSKLSKRHGATGVSEFREAGYLPEALFNYLTLLGWSPKDNREVISKEETIKLFSLEQVNTNAHRFDQNKLDWINGEYIRQKSDQESINLLKNFSKLSIPDHLWPRIIPLVKTRIKKLSDIDNWISFFVDEPKSDKLLYTKEAVDQLTKTLEILEKTNWKTQIIQQNLLNLVGHTQNWKRAPFFMNLRLAITGQKISPPLIESMEILGKEECIKRIKTIIGKLI